MTALPILHALPPRTVNSCSYESVKDTRAGASANMRSPSCDTTQNPAHLISDRCALKPFILSGQDAFLTLLTGAGFDTVRSPIHFSRWFLLRLARKARGSHVSQSRPLATLFDGVVIDRLNNALGKEPNPNPHGISFLNAASQAQLSTGKQSWGYPTSITKSRARIQ